MNTGTIARGVAVLIAWAGISGLASGQAHGRTAEEERTLTVMKKVDGPGTAGSREGIERMGEWLGTFDRLRTDLATNDGFIRSDDELVYALLFSPMEGESKLLKQYMHSVVEAMEAVPDTFYNRLDVSVAALWSEIHRLAPTVRPVSGVEADGLVKQAIEARVAQGAPEATVVRSVLTGERWTVKMTGAGLPRSEYRRGYVMYRLPDHDLVVCQQIVVERPYFGGARRVSDFGVRLGYLRLQEKP